MEIEKKIWTHDDYENMGWHDCNIYGFVIEKSEDNWNTDLVLDIDYIFKWIQPVPPKENYTFLVAPCTLIFKDVFDLKIDISTEGNPLDLFEIADIILKNKIEQEKNKYIFEWTIELQQGKIKLKSYGFEQVVRKEPIHIERQILTMEERGGTSLIKQTF